MSKHTVEPWRVTDLDRVIADRMEKVNDDYFIADCFGPDAKLNARRIVACVNAFSGIDIEKFEGKSVAEFVTSQTMLTSMGPDSQGGFGIQLEGGACRILAEAFSDQFKKSGGINFLEVSFHSEELGPLSVTMQRSEGKTPARLLAEMKDQRDELLAALERISLPDSYLDGNDCAAIARDAIAKCEVSS